LLVVQNNAGVED